MVTQSSDYTFASAQAATIPSSVGILQLQDRDHSFWRRSASQPSHAGRFQSADGAWWELMSDQVITPAMFGCSSSIPDNSAGLTSFYAYLETFECVANHEGLFPVQNAVTMGTATTNEDQHENNCSTIHGRIRLVVGAPVAGAVLRNRMKRGTKIEGISILPDPATGGASLVYAEKVFDIGLLFEAGAHLQNIDFIEIAYAKLCGVLLNGVAPGNNVFANRFGTGLLYGCGSGFQNDGAPAAIDANFLTTSYSAYVREGSSGGNELDVYQFTLFSVANVPPQIVTDRGLVSFVRVGNEEYPVESIDRTPGALKIRVWGWVPTSVAASGTIRYVFGGGLHSVGGDAGIQIGSMAITACAIGNHNGALYPGHFDLTLQHNYIGQVVGTGPANASVGGSTRGYFEGNTTDLWYLASSTPGYSYKVLADQALSLMRVKFHSPKRTPDSAKFKTKPQGLYLSYQGRFHGHVQDPDFEGQFHSHVCSFRIEPRVTALRAGTIWTEWAGVNNCIITLENWNHGGEDGTTAADFMRLFGYRSQYYLCTGPNGNGAPGTVHIKRGNNTINGVASDLAITDLTGPAFLLIERDPNNESNALVHIVAGKSGSESLGNDSVTNAHLANVAPATIKGRAIGAGTGDPQDLSPAQARAAIASDSNDGGLFLAGDGTFKAPPVGASWTVDYVSSRPSWYNLTPANLTHVIFNTSASGFHVVYLQNVANGTMIKLSRQRGGQAVTVNGSDLSQAISRRTGTVSTATIADGGTVLLTKVAANLWVGEGDFEN